MSETDAAPATRQDLMALTKWALGVAAFAMMALALTFGVGAAVLASTSESRSGMGLSVVVAVAAAVTALVFGIARDDPRLRP